MRRLGQKNEKKKSEENEELDMYMFSKGID